MRLALLHFSRHGKTRLVAALLDWSDTNTLALPACVASCDHLRRFLLLATDDRWLAAGFSAG